MAKWGFTNLKDVLSVVALPIGIALAGLIVGLYQSDGQLVAGAEKTRDDALQAYYDQMSDLILGSKSNNTKLFDTTKDTDEVRLLARARTLAALRMMDNEHANLQKNADRKRYIVRFLSEEGLINSVSRNPNDCTKAQTADKKPQLFVNLWGAYLNGVNLSSIPLQCTNLAGTNLVGANLNGTMLAGANLNHTDLTNADVTEADLTEANLQEATGITKEELEQKAKSIQGATMPDGSQHD